MNQELMMKIFELNGIVESIVELIEWDEQYNCPLIEKLDVKMKELTGMVKS
ncbi:hypothetical protein J9303_20160 [Bacillaceae bacterium Marseille-Q3522]|nr:hypothetical protein [Bacillaceae bacterium Marseille-Q3522]